MPLFDLAVIGAGAAGLFCAACAGQRGLSVLLIDHAPKLAEKIRISGGGRCNFTNLQTSGANFLSENPRFCRSALARYTPADFTDLLRAHRIGFHEKHRGQLFCDEGSERIIQMLVDECQAGQVQRWQPCAVDTVGLVDGAFALATARGPVRARRLVVATGGLSIPAIGASDFGHRLARQFGHRIVPPRPALVPLTFDAAQWSPYAALAGLALEVGIATGQGATRGRFTEDLLFTHRGLSGPAVLQISSYWQPGTAVTLDLTAGVDLAAALADAKRSSKRQLATELARHLPQRLADTWLAVNGVTPERAMPECKDRDLAALAQGLAHWPLVPTGTEGYKKAEVTAGGVDTRELDSRSLESRLQPGLHFIGEVVDVTGWLGGYNFQWAWASAAACAQACADARAGVA
ncbi:flavoprotein, HI0933 family [Burkholderiales bacterium JOSHI_001]|nr:flavoprotein, HI0933 family [Burkholderiales bacterium JOSHI_001]